MKNFKIILLFLFLFLFFPQTVLAVPLPEISNSFSAIFSHIVFLASFLFSFFAIFFKKFFLKIFKNKSKGMVFLAIVIIVFTTVVFLHKRNQTKRIEDIFNKATEEDVIDHGLEIDEESFRDLLSGEREDVIFFDARYYEEYRVGHLQNAVFWDMSWDEEDIRKKAGEIPEDTLVVFFCLEGVRSGLAAQKFSKYHPNTKFFDSWSVKLEEFWQGGIYEYGMEHTNILTPEQANNFLAKGAQVIDPRRSEVFEKEHIDGAINISITDLNYEESMEELKNLKNNKTGYIVVCYDRLSCFEGYILEYRLEFLTYSNITNKSKSLGLFPQ